MPETFPQYAFQIGIGVTLWLLIVNARREGHRWLGTLLGGIVFGFGVEFMNVHHSPPFYQYPACLASSPTLCVGGVSVWVPVGWGEIIYLSTWTAQRLRMPWYARPAAAAFLAVNLDLSLDPTAQLLHLWTWTPTVTVRLFDVPFDNFLGWYLIVALYALAARGLLRFSGRRRRADGRRNPWLDFWLPIGEALLALGAYAIVKWLLTKSSYGTDDGSTPGGIFIAVSLLVCVFTWAHAFRSRRDHEPNWAPIVIPAFFHTLCFVSVVVCGAWKAQPGILVTIPSNLILGLVLHLWPSLDVVFARVPSGRTHAVHSFFEPRGPHVHHASGLDHPQPTEVPHGPVAIESVPRGQSAS